MAQMTLQDFGSIIINKISNTQAYLSNFFKREITRLKGEGYEEDEIVNNFIESVALMRDSIETLFQKRLKAYERHLKEDGNKSDYPKPILEEIILVAINYPSGKIDTIGLRKHIKIRDIIQVENALNEISSIENVTAKPVRAAATYLKDLKYPHFRQIETKLDKRVLQWKRGG